jgi:hypothetical protein
MVTSLPLLIVMKTCIPLKPKPKLIIQAPINLVFMFGLWIIYLDEK